MMKTLDKVLPGHTVAVSAIENTGILRRRILDMGLTPGTFVTVKKVAPLGDPIELSVRGYALSMRKAEAQTITVKEEMKNA